MTEPTHELKHLFRKPPEDFFFWLESQGVDTETRKLFEQHMIDGFTFSMLTMNDLREMGVVKIGILKKLVFLIDVWRSRHQSCCFCLGLLSDHDLDCSHCCESYQSSAVSSACELHPKIWKVIISAIYAFLSLGVTSFVMVLAHERLPDISKYPPLPDILLDNLPYIPWAFEAAEIIAVCLCLIWFTVLFFHKHRLILFRRFCSLLGTVFLLRSVTMIITSLSVPGKHLLTECRPFVFDSYGERLARAAEIWFGMGMTLRGVRTCGDYMFSGHTTVITMLNFFITEYTPCCLNRLHNFTWVLNVFGVFFILAAHEHYSIDVFVAIYITSRLFLYYHWQANNQHLLQCDKQRAQIWFPLLTFFESDVHGMVPHEFSNPLREVAYVLHKRHFRWIATPLAALSLCFTGHPSNSVSSSVSPVAVSASASQGEKHE